MTLTGVAKWGGWLLLAGCLHGCSPMATTPGGGGAEAQEWVTDSDEPEVRRRARLRMELASGYFEQGKTTVALDEIKQSLVADPTYAAAYNLRGLIYMRLGEPRLAESSFQQAIKLSARDGDALHNLGWLYCQEGRYPEAIRQLSAALQTPAYGSAARTWMAQGVCQARAGMVADAERSLQRSFELDAGNPITTYNLAQLLMQRGENSRAQFYIRRLNNSELANAGSLWLGVRIEYRLNNREAMRQLGEQLRRRFPESKEAAAYDKGAFND